MNINRDHTPAYTDGCFENQSVLVVGGDGFIGSFLAEKLCELKSNVVSLGVRKEFENHKNKYLSVDIRDKEKLTHIMRNNTFDYVFNLSGYIDHSSFFKGGRDVLDVHFIGLMNLLGQVASSRLKCFINIGSSDEYGSALAPQHEALRESPFSSYSAAKVSATHLLQSLAKSENLPSVIIRPFLCYGPRQRKDRFIPQIIISCLTNSVFPVSKGTQLRDFCFVGDLVDGILSASLSKKTQGEIYNIASGIPVSIKDVVKEIVTLVGGGTPQWGAIKYRPGENMTLYADTTKAKKMLNWNTKTSLRDGLIETINYYKGSVL